MKPAFSNTDANNTQSNQALAALLEKKGALSRQIGEHKRSGISCDPLIEEMQGISRQIKQLQSKPTAHTQNAIYTEPSSFKSLPAHFNPSLQIQEEVASHNIVIHLAADMEDSIRWNTFVESQSQACAYHRFEFKKIIEQSFGQSTIYFMALDQAHNVVGILPCVFTQSRLFGCYCTSLPFFNYGGVLAVNDHVGLALIDAALAITRQRRGKHLELRETQPRANLPCRSDKVSMILNLPEQNEILWQAIGTKVRAQIKKGESHSFEFKTGQLDLLDDFYRVFSINMRDLGTPVYAKRFFHTLLTQLPKHSTLAVLYYKNQPVSGGFLLGYRDTLEIPWASTLKSANHLNANMVFYWQVLQFAIQNRYVFFDFGRSSKDAPTYRFKKQWGSEEAQLYWSYPWLANNELPSLNPGNAKYQLAITMWKKLPLWLSKVLGPRIVKNLP